MSDKNVQDIIGKVQRLLALSQGNTNENECKSARAAADRLISEYRLTLADLETKGAPAEPFVRKIVSRGGRRLQWQEQILHSLCAHYGGAFYFMSRREGGCGGRGGGEGAKGVQSYTVLARESDYAIIEYMFSYLVGEVDRLARWHTGGNGIAASNAFRVGCARGIGLQFEDLRAAMRAQAESAGQSTAMVLLSNRATEAKEELDRQVKLTKGATIGGSVRNIDAYLSGLSEGKKVQLKQRLTSGPTAPKLV
jgi:hypothetical protein